MQVRPVWMEIRRELVKNGDRSHLVDIRAFRAVLHAAGVECDEDDFYSILRVLDPRGNGVVNYDKFLKLCLSR